MDELLRRRPFRDLYTTVMYENNFTNQSIEFPGNIDGQSNFFLYFGRVYYLVLAVIGITGNIFNLVILSNKSMIKFSSTIYLLGLACADILALVFQTILKYLVYKSWQITEPRSFHIFLCVFNNWILVGAVRTSFWITVGFTIERYIAIAHPLFGKTWCTKSKAKKSLCIIYLCGFVYGTYNLAVREVTEDNRCVFSSESLKQAMGKMNAASFIITYFLLALFNGLMIYHINKQGCEMKARLAGSVVRNVPSNAQTESKRSFGKSLRKRMQFSSQAQVTFTLLTVSFVFMALLFPWLIVYMNAQLPNNVQGLPQTDTLSMCAEVMGPANSAVNFFFYNLTSRRFRKEFVRIIWEQCHSNSHSKKPTRFPQTSVTDAPAPTTETTDDGTSVHVQFNSNDRNSQVSMIEEPESIENGMSVQENATDKDGANVICNYTNNECTNGHVLNDIDTNDIDITGIDTDGHAANASCANGIKDNGHCANDDAEIVDGNNDCILLKVEALLSDVVHQESPG